MKRYILKINDSTFVSSLDWMAIEIPQIRTDSFENALLIREWYLNETVIKDGTSNMKGKTRKDLIKQHYPNVEFLPVKIVIDE